MIKVELGFSAQIKGTRFKVSRVFCSYDDILARFQKNFYI
jgi:hypothetical protein